MTGTTDLDITAERFGEIAAHIAHFQAERGASRALADEVIERLGADPAEYTAAQKHYVSAVGEGLSNDDVTLATKIGDAFQGTRRTLAERRPAVLDLGPRRGHPVTPTAETPPPPLGVDAPAAPESAPPLLDESAPLAPPPIAKPSFLQAESPESVRTPPRPAPLPSMPVPDSPIAIPPPLNVPVQKVAVPPAAIAGTQMASDIGAIARQILPFSKGDPAHSAPEPEPPKERRPAGVSGGTALGVEIPAHLKSPLPFGSSAAPAPAPPRPSPTASVASPAPALTLEQYASLSVDLQNPRNDAAALLARYGLTPEAKRAIDAHFQSLFRADPAKRAQFERACHAYTAWIAQSKGSGSR